MPLKVKGGGRGKTGEAVGSGEVFVSSLNLSSPCSGLTGRFCARTWGSSWNEAAGADL